jgi:hypothetical protein
MMFKLRVLGLLLLGLAVSLSAHAQKPQGYAVIASIQGNVEVKSRAGAWSAAKGGESVGQGDAVRTKGDSWAMLDIYEGERRIASVELKQSSELRATLLDPDKSVLLDLALGEVMIKSERSIGDKAKFEVKTLTSSVEVVGKAVFSVAVEKLE